MKREEAIALVKETDASTLPGTGINLSVPSNWNWGERVLSSTRVVLQLKTSYSAAAHILIDLKREEFVLTNVWDNLLFSTAGEDTLDIAMTIVNNYLLKFIEWSQAQGPLAMTPNTLGGFKGAFYVTQKRSPTEQEIFDAGVRSGLQRPRKSGLEAPRKKLYYLASPFSNDDKRIQESNRVWVCRKAGELIEKGIAVVSPIAHNLAVIKETGDMNTGWAHWREHDLAILSKCDKVIVLKLPGWEQSVGVAEEVKKANELDIPVDYIEMGEDYAE